MKKLFRTAILGSLGVLAATLSVAQNRSRFEILMPSPNNGIMTDKSVTFQFQTVAGWFTPTPPVIDGNLDDFSWTSPTRGNYNPAANGGKGRFEPINSSFTGSPIPRDMTRRVNFVSQKDYGVWIGNGFNFTSNPYDDPFNDADNHSASFGVLWDTTYLYLGINVINPKYVAAANGASFNNMNVEVFFNSQWPLVSYAASTSNNAQLDPDRPIFPRLYNNDHDSQTRMFMRTKTTNAVSLSTINQGWTNDGGIAFSDVNSSDPDFVAVGKPTAHGYVFEAKYKWSRINQGYMNILDPNKYDDPSKKPFENRQIGFDVGFNINSGVAGDDQRRGFVTWNSCCVNRSWSESYAFGTLRLQGQIVGSPAVTGLTITGSNITAPQQTSQMDVLVDPADASKEVTWSVVGSTSGGAPIAAISQLGLLSPLNNGTVTVIGVSKRTPSVSARKVINVSGQVAVGSVAVTGSDITQNWGESNFTASISPSNAPQNVNWSIVSGNTLGSINSVTGVFRANGLGSGTVTVRATSLADPTKFGEATINVTQTVVNSITISGFAAGGPGVNPCRTQDRMTIGGYTLGQKINIAAYYKDNTDTLRAIPADLINFTMQRPTLATQTSLAKVGNLWELTLGNPIAVVTITAVYVNNPSITSTTFTRLQSSAPTTCPGVPSAMAASLDGSEIAIYPNPAKDVVTLVTDLKKSGTASVVVLNSVGAVVSSSKVETVVGKNSITTSVADLTPGVYFVKVTLSDGQSATKKLIVSK